MDIPQTGRQPLPLAAAEERRLLKNRRRQDKSDPFATDPNPEISRLGKLALRRSDVNDLFALGDLCARQSLSKDNRLLVFYVGKALIAYRKAAQAAAHDVDRRLAQRAADEFIGWVIETARAHATRRNLAVALWASAEDEALTTPVDLQAVRSLLEAYRRAAAPAPAAALDRQDRGGEGDIDRTHADAGIAEALSDASQTVADIEALEEELSAESEFPAPPSETRVDESVQIALTSIERDIRDAVPAAARTTLLLRAAREKEFEVGDRIEGRYEVADVRFGGMGVVYLCYDHDEREPVAIKSFQARFLENERAVARFNQEALTWIRLEKHRHIVQARQVVTINRRPHIILEHVSGPENMGSDLRSWIDHRRIDTVQAVEFGLHIALGMQHATQRVPGLVHRDLKPANVLVTHTNIAKITDFGLVRSIDLEDIPVADAESDDPQDEPPQPGPRLTRAGAVVGTAPYMSPEQCQSREVDIRSDIYAFGCVVYEMLTGRTVFRARKFPAWVQAHLNDKPAFDPRVAHRLPPRLSDLVLLCLEKNPGDRPENWSYIVDELAALYTEASGEPPVLEITGPALDAHELMDKGYSLTELGRLDEALEAYDRAITLQPDYARVWARKGRTLRLLERYDEALQCYERALEIQPHYAFALNGKGIVLQRLGRWDEALACFEQAAQVNPNNVWHWYNWADVLQDMNRYEEAIPLLEKGLSLDPAHANSWGKLGQIYRLLQNYEKATEAYEHAIRLDPSYAFAHNGCGLALKALGRTQDALMSFKRATSHEPNQVWHWYNVAETLVELGQFYDAIQPAQEATRVDPNHASSWAKLGQVMRYVKRYPEAIEAYDHAIALQPDNDWAINGRGIVLEQMERYEEALACFRRAAELNPDFVSHWQNQGNVLVLLGRYEEAIPLLERATQIDPLHARSWARLGNALRRLNRLDEALQACQQATRIDPDYAWAWNEQGAALEAMRRYDEALEAYLRASDCAPGEAFYVYRQADILTLLNRFPEALQCYEQALESHPLDASALNGKGIVLQRLRRYDEALGCFEQAALVNPGEAFYVYRQADILTLLNHFPQALDLLDHALKLDNRSPLTWAKHGHVLRRLSRLDEALVSYTRAVELDPDYAKAYSERARVYVRRGQYLKALVDWWRSLRLTSRDLVMRVNLPTGQQEGG